MDLNEILAEGVRNEASDVLLKVGVPPAFRIRSDFLPLEGAAPLRPEDLDRLVTELIIPQRRAQLEKDLQIDLAYSHPDLGRFRVNVFRQRGFWSAVIRVVPNVIRTFADLHLPPSIERLANARRGLILLTGTTGSGKSTTLATMIDHINKTRQVHIITIEDPIEYEHEDQLGYINQREIGADAVSFSASLKAAMRQNPDVILVGEMRDLETIETAMLAAETGHLVMSTLHT
ncbi:MAG: type IV pili twitching motility protein PilT, partial [Candidatus Zixiibacteriota bacterium]